MSRDVSQDSSEHLLVIESAELLLQRVGGGDEDMQNVPELFNLPSSVDYAAVSGLVQRTKQGSDRRHLVNLLSRFKVSKSSLDLNAKARILQVLLLLKNSGLVMRRSAALESLRVTKQLKKSRIADPPAAPRAQRPVSLPASANVMPMSHFIKHGLYVMQGITSDVIPADGDVTAAPHSACQIAAEQLKELGQMHADIKENLTGVSKKRSLLHQSLQSGIRTQMQSFDLQMAELMAETNTPETPISLPRLLLAADKASTDLSFIRWIQIAADASYAPGGEKGGALTSTLESFSHHAAAPPGLFKSLKDAAFRPLLLMICQWVTDGALDDPHEEFFIARAREKDVSSISDDWWDLKYTLREAMLPPFVSKALADDILLAGKSINFLRRLCGDMYVMPPSVLHLMKDGHSEVDLPALVKAAKTAADERVLEVLFDEHKLAEHLHVSRSVGLLAQGDFFDELYLGRVGKMLAEHKDAVMKQKYQLAPAIDECITKTQIGIGLSIDPCQYVEVKMGDGDVEAASHSGLDNFYLVYSCPQPLRSVLRLSLLESGYRHVFMFIWKIRRIQKDLVRGRAGFKQILHARCHKSMARRPPEWWMKLHRASETANHVAHTMLQFVNALCSYMLTDGVDVLWKEFEARAKEARTLDEVIQAHKETIVAIYRHALLDGVCCGFFFLQIFFTNGIE